MKMQRLVILLRTPAQDHTIIDEPAAACSIEIRNEYGEIFSNEALFAILAGAPPEEWQKLPGEQVARVLQGRDITIRLHVDKFEVGEFQPVLP